MTKVKYGEYFLKHQEPNNQVIKYDTKVRNIEI